MTALHDDDMLRGQLPKLRQLTFSIAYRMLGSVADAEDVVQESLLRFHRARTDGTAIESEKAYLASIATRLSPDDPRLIEQRDYCRSLRDALAAMPGASAAEQAAR